MAGSALAYGWRTFLYLLLQPFPLFQLVPWMQIRLAERRINASRFGSAAFAFQGRVGRLYLPYLLTFVATTLLFVGVYAVLWTVIAPSIVPFLHAGATDPRLALAIIHRAVVPVVLGVFVVSIGGSLIGCWYWALLIRQSSTIPRWRRCASAA